MCFTYEIVDLLSVYSDCCKFELHFCKLVSFYECNILLLYCFSATVFYIVPYCFSGLAKLLKMSKINWSCTCTHINSLGQSYKVVNFSKCNKYDVNCVSGAF